MIETGRYSGWYSIGDHKSIVYAHEGRGATNALADALVQNKKGLAERAGRFRAGKMSGGWTRKQARIKTWQRPRVRKLRFPKLSFM